MSANQKVGSIPVYVELSLGKTKPSEVVFSTPVVFYLTLSPHIFYAFAVFVDLLLQVWPLVMVSSFNTAYWMNKFN